MSTIIQGLFVAEGSSDEPLADIVETLFLDRGLDLRLARPDFTQLGVKKDVESRLQAGLGLTRGDVDLVVVHRDADNVGSATRRAEIGNAVRSLGATFACCPIIPIRMTEAWLLLDEASIRVVAGNPKGRNELNLPGLREVERIADPKNRLKESLLLASASTGRRREKEAKRFNSYRRQLLQRLDRDGPVNQLVGWGELLNDIERACQQWS